MAVQAPQVFNYVNRSELETVLQQAFVDTIPDELTLNSEIIDFPGILLQFMQSLQSNTAWSDTSQTAVGQTLMRNIAAGIAHLNYGMVRANQNAFMLPGSSKETVYAAMNFLGVPLRRKVPAKIKVRLSIPDHDNPFTIPAFTSFVIDGTNFFNRKDIVFTVYETYKDVELVQGNIFTMEGTAEGIPYEKVEIGYENYNISDEDVYVYVNDIEWSNNKSLRPWMVGKNEKVFISKTLDTGNVLVQFGNNAYGKRPDKDDEIKIIWAETLGNATPSINTISEFTNNSLPLDVNGYVLSGIYGFDDELPLETYQNVGAQIRASNEVAVTRSSYVTVALQYPKIRDALFRGQAEIAPNKRNWINVVEATVLTSESKSLTENEWTEFSNYMNANAIYQVTLLRKDPLIVPVNIEANVYCNENTDLTTVKPKIINSILDFNNPKQGSIGYSLYNSDIYAMLEGSLSDTNTQNAVSYVDNVVLSYDIGFNTSLLDTSLYGIRTNGDIIADYWYFIKINKVILNMNYTTRRVLQRRDISTGVIL